MDNVVYSFDPRAGSSTDEERRGEVGSRHLCPARRSAAWQREVGERELGRQVAAIVASTRPLRLRA